MQPRLLNPSHYIGISLSPNTWGQLMDCIAFHCTYNNVKEGFGISERLCYNI